MCVEDHKVLQEIEDRKALQEIMGHKACMVPMGVVENVAVVGSAERVVNKEILAIKDSMATLDHKVATGSKADAVHLVAEEPKALSEIRVGKDTMVIKALLVVPVHKV